MVGRKMGGSFEAVQGMKLQAEREREEDKNGKRPEKGKSFAACGQNRLICVHVELKQAQRVIASICQGRGAKGN